MMGQQSAQQNALFYEFCLDKHIPKNHLLRQIDQFIDFDQVRAHLKPFYSHTGRPSIDPELMIRMLLVGYCYGIRSERRLCDEVNYNLAYRWFCNLGLEDEIPNHSSFSKNRLGRFRDADLLRYIFNTVVQRCVEEGLVGGEGFAVDASFVKAHTSKKQRVKGHTDWKPVIKQTRAVKEYFEALDAVPSLNRHQGTISLTDPMAQWTAAKGTANFFYSTNYLVDVKSIVIMDVEASPSTHGLEVLTTKTMIQRVEDNHDITPNYLLGDTAYGATENLNFIVNEKKIEPYIPVWDKSNRKDDTFSIADFTWDESRDEYRCPAQKSLRKKRRKEKVPTPLVTKNNSVTYRSLRKDCNTCTLKKYCCPQTHGRIINRSIYESARETARKNCSSDEYRRIYLDERKKVEMSFAHMKQHLGFSKLRLRGLKSANDEFLLVAIAQNLKKLAMYCGPPPFESRISPPIV